MEVKVWQGGLREGRGAVACTASAKVVFSWVLVSLLLDFFIPFYSSFQGEGLGGGNRSGSPLGSREKRLVGGFFRGC